MSSNYFDPDWTAKVTIPVKRVGERWEFFYGGDVPVKEGTVADLTVNIGDLTDDKFKQRVTQEVTVRILPEGAELCVALSDRSENARKRLGNWPDKYPLSLPLGTTRFERIRLGPPKKKAELQAKLMEDVADADENQGGLWLKVKGLDHCELHGSTIRLPQGFDPVHAVSLNHAFTMLSERYETHRLSHTGNVYERIFYQDRDGHWYPLDDLRRGVLVGAERALMVEVGDDWKQWFSGRDAHEAETAGFWLDQGLPATGDIRQWMQQLIARGLLPHSRVEQWVQDDSTQAVQLFEYLPAPLQQRFLARWQQHASELAAVLNNVNPGLIEPFFLQGVLPLGLEAREILTLYAPSSAWMHSVSDQHRSKLMQWYLLHTSGRIGDDWKQWFSGRDAQEAEAAGLWLDQGLAATDDIRQWMQQLITSGLLPHSRVEQWVQDDSTEAVQLFEYLPELLQQRFLATWQQHPSTLAAALSGANPL